MGMVRDANGAIAMAVCVGLQLLNKDESRGMTNLHSEKQ